MFFRLLLPALALLRPERAAARRAASYGPIAGSPPQVLPCNPASPAQQWLTNSASGGGLQLSATIVYANRSCLMSTKAGVTVISVGSMSGTNQRSANLTRSLVLHSLPTPGDRQGRTRRYDNKRLSQTCCSDHTAVD